MSWFDTGNGDDVIGDVPADAVRRALDEIAAMGVQRQGRAPTIGELLAAIVASLQRAPELVETSSGSGVPSRLVARFEGEVIRPQAMAIADHNATGRLVEAFHEVAQQYLEQWERKPRLSELLETLSFVLGADLPRYVTDPDVDGLELEELEQDG